jgi:hypothetical protein
MDGSGFGCSQPQFWHAMPWGRPLQHGRVTGASEQMVVVKVPGVVLPAEVLTVGLQADQAHVFDARTGKRIDPPG